MNEAADDELFHWGIECKTCLEQIALGIRLHPKLGNLYAFRKPGTFRCVHNHKHAYTADDFRFFRPKPPVTEAGIEENRSRYRTGPVELDGRLL